ncbi:hypothetical protein D9758_005990 [Tetrapyrgos nigripes]|uniref:Major facilitator superfamily (MFS) profile domain-containing protein n=1 Tax=Tetrapyrgos nigripes TaxID=182062 RepID=A0A8H5D7Y1_9AGAR|nr:hypothetical protein D9758_005990 [Tetrapyrgos nigripes]
MSASDATYSNSSLEKVAANAEAQSVAASDDGVPSNIVQAGSGILTGSKLWLSFSAMLAAMLLIALDQTILATALPRIATDFNNFSMQGWISTSFIMSQTVFLLLFGQSLRIHPSKYNLMGAMVIFEIGSLVCALSQDVNTLIAGRVVSGFGAAGLGVPIFQIISEIAPMEDRPKLFGLLAAVFALASIIGPLIGGAFTDHVTWRWCFWINLPVGGASLAAVFFLLPARPPLGSDPSKRTRQTIIRDTLNMDFVGGTLFAGSVTSLILALQWGGNQKPWDDGGVIACFVVSPVLFAIFLAWEKYIGEKAMLPLSIFSSVSMYAVMAYGFLIRFCLLLYSYYVPILYQVSRGHSATRSGVDCLPFLLISVFAVIFSGIIVGKVQRYWHVLVIAPVFLAIGSGLWYSIDENISNGALSGYQILVGFGIGLGMQNVMMAIQVEFKDQPRYLGQANSMAQVCQTLGGTIGLGIAEPVFSSQLDKFIPRYAPNVPEAILKNAPTSIRAVLPPDQVLQAVKVYVQSLRIVYLVAVPVAGVALIVSLFIKNAKLAPQGAAAAPKPKEESEA